MTWQGTPQEVLQRVLAYAQEVERATQPGDAQTCAQHIQREVTDLLRHPAITALVPLPESVTISTTCPKCGTQLTTTIRAAPPGRT